MQLQLDASVLLLLVGIAIGGCASSRASGPYMAPSEASRNSLKAQLLTQKAAAIMDEEPDGGADKAEALLREALAEDLYHGPAHNNLGVIHLGRDDLYEAAHEFEWARKLMPGQPEPRMNLAITLERAGRLDEALSTYRTALEVCSGHMPSIEAIARLQVRHGRTDEETKKLLQEIAFVGESAEWREWAKEQMIRLEVDDQN